MARRLGIKQPNVHRWRSGAVRPSKMAIKAIATTFGLTEDQLLHGDVDESAVDYDPPLTRAQQRIIDIFDRLVKTGDKDIIDHLDRQISLLINLLELREKSKSSNS